MGSPCSCGRFGDFRASSFLKSQQTNISEVRLVYFRRLAYLNKMKQLILILLIIFITPDFLFCQELIEKKKLGKESFIGIKAGLFLSKYGKGKEYGSVPL